ncbi:protein lin-41-like [Mytilus edulis]|uniref:protein lin-41-like n=1 Tax=Mytilus edulis TaxID=6550 RepID=UPI0039EF2765
MSMASVHHICHLCEEEYVSNVAVVWCADCENFLCKDCDKHHSRIKASKDHQTIAIDDYEKLPSFIVDIKNRCVKHDQKYDFYCKFHGDPCCVMCIKDNHNGCRDLDPLVEVLRDIKTSAKVSNLDKEFDILLENFDTVVKYLNSRMVTLQENKTESLKEIRNLRASINKHLDEIEQKILDDISVEFNKIKQKSNHISNEIGTKKVVIQNLQNDLAKMTMYATDLQIYVGLQYLEKSTLEEVGYLNELQGKGQLEEIRFESKLSSDLKCLTSNIRKFGTAVVHSSPCTLQLKSSGEYQVNLSVSHLLTIDSINPKLKTTLRVPKLFKDMKIFSCLVLSDCRNLLLDTVSKSLLLFSKEGEYIEKVISFNDKPNDFCYIKGNLIAVTFFRDRKLLLVDLLQKQIRKTIRVTGLCFGIDSDGKTLVVSLTKRNIIVTLDLEGNILSEIGVPGECTIRTALHKNNIVCSDWKGNHIYCYTSKGILLWKYKHEGICKPFGITIDTNGFIYIACRGNDKIVVLSEDGKTSRTILSKENGIDKPCAINVNKTLSTLLVTNSSNGDAFVFKI